MAAKDMGKQWCWRVAQLPAHEMGVHRAAAVGRAVKDGGPGLSLSSLSSYGERHQYSREDVLKGKMSSQFSAIIQPLHSPTLSAPSPGTWQTRGNSLISPAVTESNVWSENLPEKHSGFQEGV